MIHHFLYTSATRDLDEDRYDSDTWYNCDPKKIATLFIEKHKRVRILIFVQVTPGVAMISVSFQTACRTLIWDFTPTLRNDKIQLPQIHNSKKNFSDTEK